MGNLCKVNATPKQKHAGRKKIHHHNEKEKRSVAPSALPVPFHARTQRLALH